MNPYFEQTILNADPLELTQIVFQRAISCAADAREYLRRGQIAERSAAILRAYAAIGELLSSLQPERAPDLSGRLAGLYLYMQERLIEANGLQADEPLAEVLALLMTLAEAWSGAAAQLAAGKATSGPESGSWQHGHEDSARLALQA